MRAGKTLLLLPAVVLLATCAWARAERSSPFEPGSQQQLMIDVENRNFNDATLHAVSTGRRVRLGVVGGMSSATFEIPWTTLGDIRIEVNLLAGPSFRTRSLNAGPGDRLALWIDSTAGRSTFRR